MRKNKAEDRNLVQEAADRPLNEDENVRLQQYESTGEGKAYHDVHAYLQNELPEYLPQFRMNAHKRKALALQLNERVQGKRQGQRVVFVVRSFATVTAVFLIAFLGYNWLVADNFSPEPAAEVVTMVPRLTATPSLGPRMKYANLEAAPVEPLAQLLPQEYTQTIPETAVEVDFDLLIPTQLDADVTFVGSMVDHEQNATEIVFRSALKVASWHRLWFLDQTPLVDADKNKSIPITYQVPWGEDVIGTNSIDLETVEVLNTEGVYEGYDLMYSDIKHYDLGEVISVRMLSWQTDDQQLTLTVISPNPITADDMKQTIEKWQLTPYVP